MSEWLTRHPDLVIAVIKVAAVVLLLLTGVAYLSWYERKLVAHIQTRWGPYRVGPHGLFQPLADGLKFLFKEDVSQPNVTSPFIYWLAPFLALTVGLLSIAVIPFGGTTVEILARRSGFYIADVNLGVLFILAVTSLSVYAVVLAGWASNSKYPLLGGLRSAAQMVSYELALVFSVIGVLIHAGTLSLRKIVEAQAASSWTLPHWYVFPQIVGFLCFFISAVAETNRLPFDLPEAESELVAGFHTEYSSFKFAMFFMAEYANMITASCLATILFFGGWLSPFPETRTFAWTRYLSVVAPTALAIVCFWDALRLPRPLHRVLMLALGLGLVGLAGLVAQPAILAAVQGIFWFLAKVGIFLSVYVWIRGTLPRFRYDQLMAFSWKFLFPVAVANVIVTSFVVALRVSGQ